MNKLLVICGPTATGKTSLAVRIAGKIPAELVSADSRQIFKGMDIGTGKDLPGNAELQGEGILVPYGVTKRLIRPYSFGPTKIWLLDVVSCSETFSVTDYVAMARPVIRHIWQKDRLPLVVGGSGLYIRTLLDGNSVGVPPDENLRRELDGYPVKKLQEILSSENPRLFKSLNSSDVMNPHRLIRKIEITRSGKNANGILSGLEADILTVGLTDASSGLYPRIDARVDARMEKGLLKEISELLGKGYGFNLKSFTSLGYREWKPWFDGSVERNGETKQNIVSSWKYHEHAYARRQMTWFKKVRDIRWFDAGVPDNIKNVEQAVLAWYTR